MDTNTTRNLNTLVFAFFFSLAVGLFLASLYSTFTRYGFSQQTIDSFNFFAFWFETPFHLGYATPTFRRGLLIIGVTGVVLPAVVAIMILRNGHHHGTARWAGLHELIRAGYLRRYAGINGPIFGKTTGPRWPGRYLTYPVLTEQQDADLWEAWSAEVKKRGIPRGDETAMLAVAADLAESTDIPLAVIWSAIQGWVSERLY